MTVEPYLAAALQLRAISAESVPDAASARARALDRIGEVAQAIAGTRAFLEKFTGLPLKLAVLPEYLFTGFETGRVPDFRARAVFDADGPEYRALADLAAGQGLHLAGNAYESDPHFPDLHFQASFLFAPDGNRVLTYRRLYSLYTPSPHDVWSEYRRHYTLDQVFPVADTAIGRIAAIASEEILFPEIARAHALRGAELFVHSSSEAGGLVPTGKHAARVARALENMAYLVSANTAGIEGGGLAGMSADGNSAVVDYRGRVLAEALSGENANAFAEIDIEGLRRHRRKPGMANYLSRQRLELFRETFAGVVQPADSLLTDGGVTAPDREHFARGQAEVIARLGRDGLI
jgi:predicted amidohydrolase